MGKSKKLFVVRNVKAQDFVPTLAVSKLNLIVGYSLYNLPLTVNKDLKFI